ncbi:hypothetical protein ACMD2_25240, partial [Ananas comosus]
SGSFYF